MALKYRQNKEKDNIAYGMTVVRNLELSQASWVSAPTFFLLLNGLESCRDCPLDEERYSRKMGPADSLLPL